MSKKTEAGSAKSKLSDILKNKLLQKTQKKKSVAQAYRDLLDKKQAAPATAKPKKVEMPADSVKLSPAATVSMPQVSKGKKGQSGKSPRESIKSRIASAIAIKQLVAKSAEMYFNVDNPMTFNFIGSEVEKLMEKLIKDMGVKTEKVIDAKLEGKHVSSAKIFESLAVMIALDPLIGGSKRNKKARAKYATKVKDLKTKLQMLGFDLDDGYLMETALTQGEDFLNMLKDMQREVNNRLSGIQEFEQIMGVGSVI